MSLVQLRTEPHLEDSSSGLTRLPSESAAALESTDRGATREFSLPSRSATAKDYLLAALESLSQAHPQIPVFAALAGISRPAAYRILSRLADTGAVSFTELEEELHGWPEWVALAQLFRAGYAAEGVRHLHITSSGRDALVVFRAKNPAIPS